MDTIDINIDAPATPLEKQQAIERAFVEKSNRAGAINARIIKKTRHWTFCAGFVDTEKAALYAGGLTNDTLVVLSSVDMKPTNDDTHN